MTDILIGDVWVASGQSNMEFPVLGTEWKVGVQHAEREIIAANYPQIRVFAADKKIAARPRVILKRPLAAGRFAPTRYTRFGWPGAVRKCFGLKVRVLVEFSGRG